MNQQELLLYLRDNQGALENKEIFIEADCPLMYSELKFINCKLKATTDKACFIIASSSFDGVFENCEFEGNFKFKGGEKGILIFKSPKPKQNKSKFEFENTHLKIDMSFFGVDELRVFDSILNVDISSAIIKKVDLSGRNPSAEKQQISIGTSEIHTLELRDNSENSEIRVNSSSIKNIDCLFSGKLLSLDAQFWDMGKRKKIKNLKIDSRSKGKIEIILYEIENLRLSDVSKDQPVFISNVLFSTPSRIEFRNSDFDMLKMSIVNLENTTVYCENVKFLDSEFASVQWSKKFQTQIYADNNKLHESIAHFETLRPLLNQLKANYVKGHDSVWACYFYSLEMDVQQKLCLMKMKLVKEKLFQRLVRIKTIYKRRNKLCMRVSKKEIQLQANCVKDYLVSANDFALLFCGNFTSRFGTNWLLPILFLVFLNFFSFISLNLLYDLGYGLDFSFKGLDIFCDLIFPWKSETLLGIPKVFICLLTIINSYLIFQVIQGFRKYNRKF